MNLILIDPSEVRPSGEVRILGVRADHLVNTLRVTLGQSVQVGLLNGPRGAGTVSSLGEGVDLQCVFEESAPKRPRIDLLLAVPRPKVLRRLWAQIAALGVGRIILTNAERVERAYFDTHVVTPQSYRPLLIEGLQQARDTILPEVSIHRRFKVLVEDDLDRITGKTIRLVADPSGAASAGAVLRARLDHDRDARVLLAVGPEGGWNAFELELLATHGFHCIGMGPRALRTDTACVALLALVHDALATNA